mmetsp:Transcript_10855/g.14112  ORF Transcript_10855/g.14112 Transcript_10855/m.14112 type:complete len:588 (+) Transcript_10855:8-1771(+)
MLRVHIFQPYNLAKHIRQRGLTNTVTLNSVAQLLGDFTRTSNIPQKPERVVDSAIKPPSKVKNHYVVYNSVATHYDLICIGSGPGAQKCAIDSAKRGKRVAIVDKEAMQGGVCVHTGTVPSKTFREAVLHLTGYRHQGFYGKSYQPWQKRISVPDILTRVQKVELSETDIIRDQIRRNGIDIITGTAKFIAPLNKSEGGPTRISVMETGEEKEAATSLARHLEADKVKTVLSADKYLIACGTRPIRPEGVPFDGKQVFESDQILWGGVSQVPRRLIVVGAGVIGMEYASMVNVIPGTTVTVIDGRKEVFGFVDSEITDTLCYLMRNRGARFLLGEQVSSVEKSPDRVVVHLESGKSVTGEAVLYCMGRKPNVDSLQVEALGEGTLECDSRGLLQVNDFYQTSIPNIYAAGDVIGYPALASTSMEQGRRASLHMWGLLGGESDSCEDTMNKIKSVVSEAGFLGRLNEQLFPYGIYTIPEISMIGKTEKQLTAEKIPFEIGSAKYSQLAKGQMLGGMDGLLKILFCPTTLKILGVHAIGEGATEIIHIGQAAMKGGGTLEYFRNSVFNYPTLAEAYSVAAYDGFQRIQT